MKLQNTMLVLAVSLTACVAPLRRAASKAPAVLATAGSSQCQPVAVRDIENTGACRVQVVAKSDTGEVLRASPWIGAGRAGDRFELPSGFAWVVLEVDPACSSRLGVIRYQVDRACAQPRRSAGDEPLAPRVAVNEGVGALAEGDR